MNEDGKRKIDENGGDVRAEAPKKMKGQNKNRRNFMFKEMKKNFFLNKKMCLQFCREGQCGYGDGCTFSHDLDDFVKNRDADLGDVCYNYSTFGKCPYGLLCCYGSAHLREGKYNMIEEDKFTGKTDGSTNFLTKDILFNLRRKKYNFDKANNISKGVGAIDLDAKDGVKREPRASLKSQIDFKDKLYLAPLTTVGNLPFRRICKEYGADVTCGEMALCTNLLEGNSSEWALLRRHHSEDLFGVQICGSHADQMGRCAQLISEQCEVDFIDLNMGCPIELIFQKGGGSALMQRKKKLNEIIYGEFNIEI